MNISLEFLEKINRNLKFKNWKYTRLDILNDICVKHSNEFFGDIDDSWISVDILHMIKAGDSKSEIQDYIWENCIFNPASRYFKCDNKCDNR